MSTAYFETPIGLLKLTADQRKLRSVRKVFVRDTPESSNAVTEEVKHQLTDYFSGKRTAFQLALLPHGTPFQIAVWDKLAQVPYGRVVTYGQLAAAIGRPNACRAVANAVGKNPLLIFIPCHRVVASNGLGGFSSGLETKRALLRLEDVEITASSRFQEKYFFTFF